MAQYTVKAPDGKIITLNGPEGASEADVIAIAQQLYKPEAPSGFAKGLKDLVSGGGQAVARGLETAAEYVGYQPAIDFLSKERQKYEDIIKKEEEQYQAQRKAAGETGIDWGRIGGNIANPLNYVGGAPTTIPRLLGMGAIQGAATPIYNTDQYGGQLVQNIGEGTLTAGLFGAGAKAFGGAKNVVSDLVAPFTEKGRQRMMQEYVQKIVPEASHAKVAEAIRNPEQFIPGSMPSVGEAVSNIPEAVNLASLQARIATNPNAAPIYAAREAEREAARAAAIGRLGGTEQNIAEAEAARRSILPQGQEALAQANIAGEVAPTLENEIAKKTQESIRALQTGGKLATEAAQQSELAKNWIPVAGMPRVPGKYSLNADQVYGNLQGAREAGNVVAQRKAEADFKKFQLESLMNEGFYPLETAPIVSKIDSILSTPGKRASTLVQQSLGEIKNKILNLTNERGIINSNDLYTIRKEIGTDIQRFAKETGNWDQKLVAGLDTNLKNAIDTAIESAGGTGWKSYLKSYSNASTKINRMEIGKYLQDTLQGKFGVENAGAFATAMANAPSTIKKSTGVARYTKLEDVLSPAELKDVQGVLKDFQRGAAYKELAGKAVQGSKFADGEAIPHFLSRIATITNYGLKKAGADADAKINKAFAELSNEKWAALFDAVPPNKAQAFVNSFFPRLTPEVQNKVLKGFGLVGAEALRRESAIQGEQLKQQPIQQPVNANPQSKREIQGIVSSVMAQKNVPPELARVIPAIIQTESSWNPTASNKNSSAKGLFQMTNAARADVGIPRNATVQQDIEGGIDYLLKQYRKYGNVRQAIQAYNQGHYNPKSKEGRQYVATVMGNL